jgi:Flp pilus assembly pilin Flp
MTDYLNMMIIRLSALWKREDGQTMAEYGIILVVIAVVAAAAFATVGGDITKVMTEVSKKLAIV